MFGWLKGDREVAIDHCADIQVKVVEAALLRDRDFTEAEAFTLLAAALAPTVAVSYELRLIPSGDPCGIAFGMAAFGFARVLRGLG